MEVFDFALDDDFDLVFENGDIKLTESTLQHQKCLLLAEKGEFKQDPEIGIGLKNFINDDKSLDELKAVIQEEYENDGMAIDNINGTSAENLEITAHYENS